jgi:DNA-binding IclR family transcriptional regulator
MAVIEALVRVGPDASLSAIAAACGSPKPTVHRFLADLAREQYVFSVGRGNYRVGPRLMSLSGRVLNSIDYVHAAAQPLEALRASVLDTIHLGVLVGNQAVYAAKLEGPRPYHLRSAVGMPIRLDCTAIGRAILANLPMEQVLGLVDLDRLSRRTASTIVTRSALLNELARVRTSGYAIDDEQNEVGVRCVAAPVMDSTGMAVAAISVSGPAFDMSRHKARLLAPLVISTASEVSKTLGYVGARS